MVIKLYRHILPFVLFGGIPYVVRDFLYQFGAGFVDL